MVVQEPVQAAIWNALNHYAYPDATFLAERLYAEVGSDEGLFLLATCYYRSGKAIQAYTLLQQKGCPTAQCKYLMAQCCLDIAKLSEAESILAGSILTKAKTHEDLMNEFGDSSCYVLRLLGKIYSKTERTVKAGDQFKRSLKLNPFMWSSFESLCQLGEKPDPTKVFQLSSCPNFQSMCHPSVPAYSPQPEVILSLTEPQDTPIQTPAMTPFISDTPENMNIDSPEYNLLAPPTAPRRTRLMKQSPRPGRSVFGGPGGLSPMTPSFGILPLEATPSPGFSQGNGPLITPPILNLFATYTDNKVQAPRKSKQQQQAATRKNYSPAPKLAFSQSGNTNTTNTRDAQTPSPQPQGLQSSNIMPGVRRSSRLFSNASSSSVKENNKSQSQKKFASPKAPAKKSKTRSSKTQQELNEINKAESSENKPSTVTSAHMQVYNMQRQSAEGLMLLLQDLGKAYVALSQYDCARALQLFSSLPPHHYHTGWVMCHVGRAHFEMAQYSQAEKAFCAVRQLEPYHMEGMELYSTALWHLQKEVQLSALAHELTELDKHSPEAWCATGNCFSIQKEHDVAIKFFQRAVQVEPQFAYAYTLLGHEYVSTEEWDKAMSCYRNAIAIDSRHYKAWYGIGSIYYRQEKFALAEVHYRKALTINPQNSVLLCHVGMAQHLLKKSESALATLSRAIQADPKNPLCRFHRASILFATDKHKEALSELEELKQIVPRESLVYFLIGKVHKKLGNTHLALMNFSWAMDLDPKGANNHIKEAVDKRYVTDEDDPSQGVEDASGLDDLVDSSNNSSIMEPDDVQLQAIESDESL